MYRVIYSFADLTDRQHIYKVGDQFPHDGLSVSEERLKELSTSANKIGVPLIKGSFSIEDEFDTQPVGETTTAETPEAEEAVTEVPEATATETATKPKKGKRKADASAD